MRIKEPRALRRLRIRQEVQARLMTPELPVHLRQGRPRYGWVLREEEPKSERAKTIEKFGERANERSGDRRVRGMTPEEVKQWLKHNGINDGVDRRKAERRRR